jgi:hypothetical protein
MTIFTMHKLKPGASFEDYKKWSKQVDQPKSNAQPEILNFEVYAIHGTLDAGKEAPDYDVIEVIDVRNVEDIDKVEERLRDFLDNEWLSQWVEESTLINIYGEKI